MHFILLNHAKPRDWVLVSVKGIDMQKKMKSAKYNKDIKQESTISEQAI